MKKTGRAVYTINTDSANPRNGEGSFVRLTDGSILFSWTAFLSGDGDHDTAVLKAVTSRDEGESWSEPRILFKNNPGDINNMSPSFVRLADGALGVCYLCKRRTENGLLSCMPVFRRSDDEGLTWSAPTFCANIPSYYCGTNDASKVLSSGRIITPVSDGGLGIKGQIKPFSVVFFCSDDNGFSWFKLPGVIVPPFGDRTGMPEPGLTELADGTLWCHGRTLFGYQYQSISKDGGCTWTPAEPNPFFTSPDSPMRVEQTVHGTVIVFNPRVRNAVNEDYLPWGSLLRTPLVCAVYPAGDEGYAAPASEFTWKSFEEFRNHCVILEDDPNGSFCYPAVTETSDGWLIAYYAGGSIRQMLNYTKIIKIIRSEL